MLHHSATAYHSLSWKHTNTHIHNHSEWNRQNSALLITAVPVLSPWSRWWDGGCCLMHTHTDTPHTHITCYEGSGWGNPLIYRVLSWAKKHTHLLSVSASLPFPTHTHTEVVSWLGGLGGPGKYTHLCLSLCLCAPPQPLSGMLLSPGSKCLEISSHTPDGKQPQLSPLCVLLLTGSCSLDRTHSLFTKGWTRHPFSPAFQKGQKESKTQKAVRFTLPKPFGEKLDSQAAMKPHWHTGGKIGEINRFHTLTECFINSIFNRQLFFFCFLFLYGCTMNLCFFIILFLMQNKHFLHRRWTFWMVLCYNHTFLYDRPTQASA